jgi:D-alanyl-D-alanine endopeptidase (penicillin-binding protein 7)
MFFSKRTFDFYASVGVMVLKMLLVISAPVSIKKIQDSYPVLSFPLANLRSGATTGTVAVADKIFFDKILVPLPKNTQLFSAKLTARAVLVVEDATETILFDKNSSEIRPLASITKLMSLLVLADMPLDWSSTTTILSSDATPDEHHVKIGESYSLNQLRIIGLVGSSNTAVNALARMGSTSSESFVTLMNQKAQKLHLFSMHFVEPTGLDSKNSGNALDIVRLLKLALLNKDISDALHTPEYDIQLFKKKSRPVWNTNWLLTRWVPHTFLTVHVVGKTGYIEDSGYNFVVRLEDEDKHAIRVAVLGAASNEARFTEARDIGGWIFGHYVWPDQNNYRNVVK